MVNKLKSWISTDRTDAIPNCDGFNRFGQYAFAVSNYRVDVAISAGEHKTEPRGPELLNVDAIVVMSCSPVHLRFVFLVHDSSFDLIRFQSN